MARIPKRVRNPNVECTPGGPLSPRRDCGKFLRKSVVSNFYAASHHSRGPSIGASKQTALLDLVHFLVYSIFMRSTRLNMHDAKTHLSRHISAMKGDDRLIICNRHRPVAEVRLLPQPRTAARRIGVAKGEFQVPAAFFEPLPDDLLEAFAGRA